MEFMEGESMSIKVIELKGNKNYKEWMEANGDKIEVIDIQSTAKLWNLWTGAIGSALKGDKNYTVTYKEK
jgi:hypothetical protein